MGVLTSTSEERGGKNHSSLSTLRKEAPAAEGKGGRDGTPLSLEEKRETARS